MHGAGYDYPLDSPKGHWTATDEGHSRTVQELAQAIKRMRILARRLTKAEQERRLRQAGLAVRMARARTMKVEDKLVLMLDAIKALETET